MKTKAMLVVAVVFAVVAFASQTAFSKPEFAKSTGKPCTECHVKAGDKALNDAGKKFCAEKKAELKLKCE